MCTQGEQQAIALGAGPDAAGGSQIGNMQGVYKNVGIAEGASPLIVCDSGSSPAFSNGGFSEIAASEFAPSGTTYIAHDGTELGGIYAIQIVPSENDTI